MKFPEQLLFMKNRKAVQKHSDESMNGKLCVVSGATSGVGYETIKKLAAGKANIVMLVRNENKAKAVKEEIEKKHSVFVDYFIADFSDLKQVKKAVLEISEKYPRVDVLINSAGLYSTKRIVNEEGYEMVFCVNHLATFLITKLLMNKLIESSPSRIIQVNSEGHRFNGLNVDDLNWEKRTYTGLRSYGASKTAQLLTVWKFAQELKGTGVTINAMHPGGVRTNIGNNNGRLYRWFLHHITWHFLKDPKISGEAIYYLASASELNNVSGVFFNLTIKEKPAKHALNTKKQEEIWNKSLEMTGLIKKDG
ncbi:SDR family NAD(P)-dependent oxidoreductase [Lacticigenium naphthae]|uniref:SDR family NAD(P)-dependent oxidoreductase n=1 Tax=Lacticigenium naphthae TaxID=515351 RepID=UPI000401FA0D|nr:SDR family NAD(P)-dependent oxidoreductase [Lacticigenium naphthae]